MIASDASQTPLSNLLHCMYAYSGIAKTIYIYLCECEHALRPDNCLIKLHWFAVRRERTRLWKDGSAVVFLPFMECQKQDKQEGELGRWTDVNKNLRSLARRVRRGV